MHLSALDIEGWPIRTTSQRRLTLQQKVTGKVSVLLTTRLRRVIKGGRTRSQRLTHVKMSTPVDRFVGWNAIKEIQSGCFCFLGLVVPAGRSSHGSQEAQPLEIFIWRYPASARRNGQQQRQQKESIHAIAVELESVRSV